MFDKLQFVDSWDSLQSAISAHRLKSVEEGDKLKLIGLYV